MTDIPDDIGPLRNQRHEMFCIGLAAGKTQLDAYRQAGYAGKPRAMAVTASHLARHPKIQQRLAALRAAKEEIFVLTKDWLINQMREVSQEAREDRAHSPAIRALELLGREKNTFVEQTHVTVRTLRELTAEELEELIATANTNASAPAAGRGRKGRTGKAAA